MTPMLNISIKEDDHIHSGILLDLESVEKAGPELFQVVIGQLIAHYKKSTQEKNQGSCKTQE
jgi:hypothetical protein